MRLNSLSTRACDRWINFAIALLCALPPALLQAQPANNNFASAQIITGSSGSVTGNTFGATREMGEPNHGGDPGGASVWYSWDAPTSGAAEFELHASDFDTTMGAYTGVSVSNLTAVAQNDDEFEYFPLVSKWLALGTQSRIRFPAQAGTRYHIGVDGGGGLSGNIRLGWNLKPRPANDNFADAQIITGPNGFISTHNVGATKEAGEPNHATNAGSASIWFRWTAPVSGATRFSTLNSLTSSSTALDTLLAIYTGNSLGSLTQIAANDNNGSSLRSLVQFTATVGTTYRIAVDTKAASTNHGHVLLTWINGTPANNNFSSAQVLINPSLESPRIEHVDTRARHVTRDGACQLHQQSFLPCGVPVTETDKFRSAAQGRGCSIVAFGCDLRRRGQEIVVSPDAGKGVGDCSTMSGTNFRERGRCRNCVQNP